MTEAITARGAPLAALARRCWHAVATLGELRAAAPSPLAVTLLGERLAIAQLTAAGGPKVVAFADRCPHRSARLSLGSVVTHGVAGTALRCAYHGWSYGADGGCVSIPAAPDLAIPEKARATAYEVQEAYGLLWVRLEAGWPTVIPVRL